MVTRIEIKCRRCPPLAHLDREVFRVAIRTAVLGQVWDGEQELLQLLVKPTLFDLAVRDLRLEGSCTLDQWSSVVAALASRPDLLGDAIGLRASLVDLPNGHIALAKQLVQLA